MISALSRRFAAHPVTTAVPRNLALPGFRATRALNTIPKLSSQQEQRGKSWSKAPFVAIAGCVLGSAALVTASAEEQKHDAMFKSSQVQVR